MSSPGISVIFSDNGGEDSSAKSDSLGLAAK